MKQHFATLMLLIASIQHAKAATSFECIALDHALSTKLIISTPYDGDPDTLTVKVAGRTVYHKVAVVSHLSGQTNTFESPTFRNKNRAPSSLFVKLYASEGKLVASFSEISYLPVVNHFSAECREL